ncbi:MAG: hypothetical protein ABRQ39_29890, partial [Candidatus Eremiobacterota bacterium]
MLIEQLKPNIIVRGTSFDEPVEIAAVIPVGRSMKIIGKGLNTGKFVDFVLSPEQVATLEATPEQEPFDGDPL